MCVVFLQVTLCQLPLRQIWKPRKRKEIGHAIIPSDKRVINALCSREAEYNRTGNERKSKVFHFRAIGQLSKDSIKVLRRTHASV